jgi:hypothetical protein
MTIDYSLMFSKIALLVVGCGLATAAFGQRGPDWMRSEADTSYVRDLSRDLTTRLYFSRKYAGYGVRDYRQRQELLYRPNSRLNVGIGFNYAFAGVNIAVNLPGANNDDDRYGPTRFLDAQSHLYLPRFAVDLYLQRYEGYYLNKPQTGSKTGSRAARTRSAATCARRASASTCSTFSTTGAFRTGRRTCRTRGRKKAPARSCSAANGTSSGCGPTLR